MYLLSISNRLHYLFFFILQSTIKGLLSRHETEPQVSESHGCRYAGSALSVDAPVCWNYLLLCQICTLTIAAWPYAGQRNIFWVVLWNHDVDTWFDTSLSCQFTRYRCGFMVTDTCLSGGVSFKIYPKLVWNPYNGSRGNITWNPKKGKRGKWI